MDVEVDDALSGFSEKNGRNLNILGCCPEIKAGEGIK